MANRKVDTGFGSRLREIRNESGMSQADLAELVDMPVQSISRYERGDRAPSWAVVIRFADALGVPLDAFRPKDENTPE